MAHRCAYRASLVVARDSCIFILYDCVYWSGLLVYHDNGKGVQDVDLPTSLTLNGVIALLSTLVRAALMISMSSALSQEI